MNICPDEVGIVIQARMGSQRMPGKVMKLLGGEPLLGVLIRSLRDSKINFPIVVATSKLDRDDVVFQYCLEIGIPCFRGSESNVLLRYKEVARKTKFNHILRLTGDNPFVNSKVIECVIKSHFRSGADISSTRRIDGEHVTERYAPKGHSVDIIRAEVLRGLDVSTLTAFEKEHVIPVFFNGSYKVNVVRPMVDGLVESTVDTPEDLEQLKSMLLLKKG